jgi:hypothetical protein
VTWSSLDHLRLCAGRRAARVGILAVQVHADHQTPAPAIWLCVVLGFLAAVYSGAYAVITSISTIGLYPSYIIPVWLALAGTGNRTRAGAGTVGSRALEPVVNGLAMIWVAFLCVVLSIPDGFRTEVDPRRAGDAGGSGTSCASGSILKARAGGTERGGRVREMREAGQLRGMLSLDDLRELVAEDSDRDGDRGVHRPSRSADREALRCGDVCCGGVA